MKQAIAKRRCRICTFIWGVVLLGVFGYSNHAKGETDVSVLFDRLVVAEGRDYFRGRDQLLKLGDDIIPFLEAQANRERFEICVIARAMLSWIQDSEVNTARTKLLLSQAYFIQLFRTGPAREVVSIAMLNRTGRTGPFRDVSVHFPEYDSAEACLMEVALKGLDPAHNEFLGIESEPQKLDLDQAINQEVAQAVAAALLVGSEDKDVVEAFKVLYKTGGRTMRRVAAIGLDRVGIQTDEPLEERIRWAW